MEIVFSDILAKWRCRLVEFGGEADHVHLLVEGHPAMDLSRLIGNLKAVSSRHMRNEFGDHLSAFYCRPVFWNKAYAVISVGSLANLETLITYIQDQDTPLD
jgi:putative transposase